MGGADEARLRGSVLHGLARHARVLHGERGSSLGVPWWERGLPGVPHRGPVVPHQVVLVGAARLGIGHVGVLARAEAAWRVGVGWVHGVAWQALGLRECLRQLPVRVQGTSLVRSCFRGWLCMGRAGG